jgi:hypothetical protein
MSADHSRVVHCDPRSTSQRRVEDARRVAVHINRAALHHSRFAFMRRHLQRDPMLQPSRDGRPFIKGQPYEQRDTRPGAHHASVRRIRSSADARKARAELGVLVSRQRRVARSITEHIDSREGEIDRPDIGEVHFVHEMDPAVDSNGRRGGRDLNLQRGARGDSELREAPISAGDDQRSRDKERRDDLSGHGVLSIIISSSRTS